MLKPQMVTVDYEKKKGISMNLLKKFGMAMLQKTLYFDKTEQKLKVGKALDGNPTISRMSINYDGLGNLKSIFLNGTYWTEHIPSYNIDLDIYCDNDEIFTYIDIEVLDEILKLSSSVKTIYFTRYCNHLMIQYIMTCAICFRESRYNLDTFREEFENRINVDACCRGTYNSKSMVTPEKSAESGIAYIDRFRAKCIKDHEFMLSQDTSRTGVSKCPICRIESKYKFFDIMKKMNVLYTIKETFSEYPKVKSRDLNLLHKLEILLFNKSNHILGKIVFEDIKGEKQAKCNRQNIEFSWFEPQYLDDEKYCISFFNILYKRIVKRYNLSSKIE